MQDPHKQKAAEIFGVPYDKVTSEQRAYAKQVTYTDRYSNRQTFAEVLRSLNPSVVDWPKITGRSRKTHKERKQDRINERNKS